MNGQCINISINGLFCQAVRLSFHGRRPWACTASAWSIAGQMKILISKPCWLMMIDTMSMSVPWVSLTMINPIFLSNQIIGRTSLGAIVAGRPYHLLLTLIQLICSWALNKLHHPSQSRLAYTKKVGAIAENVKGWQRDLPMNGWHRYQQGIGASFAGTCFLTLLKKSSVERNKKNGGPTYTNPYAC